VDYDWSVLYTRYTNMSIVDSVKPEVSDKIELLGYESRVNDTSTQIEKGKNRIAFKGIKTGSKVQTANLKSLSGFNCFVVDEAEEIPDYETFKKVFYSIRSTQKRNLTILILNPTTKEHWIFKEFFEKKGLEGGENTIVDNVMYIHTSYLDVNKKYIPENIRRDYERLKIDNPEKYENIVVGGWIRDPEGVLLPKSKLKFADLSIYDSKNMQFRFAIGDPADLGGDKFSMPFIDVFYSENDFAFLVRDVIHNTNGIEANAERIIDKMKFNCTEQIFIESNGVGLAAVLLIKKMLSQHQKLSAFPSTENKEVRIFSHYEFVQKYFIFDKEKSETDAEYKAFISDLTSYSKEGDNKHKKDAIDVICGAANIIKLKYSKILYGK
ncbi:MAG TPA: phage terminase large subunit, partial [bacterium]|nr:phage terminase large subunit [bacterium]